MKTIRHGLLLAGLTLALLGLVSCNSDSDVKDQANAAPPAGDAPTSSGLSSTTSPRP